MKRRLSIFGALVLAISLPATSFAASTLQFSDVPQTKHFAEAVYDLAERNIIGGYPDGTFKPGNSITRGQAAAIIAKMTNLDTTNVKNPGYKDVSTANGYYKAIAAMTEKGMISGYGDGRFGPNDPIKRGQMASIIVKAFDLPREPIYNHPFKDLSNNQSHTENILAIYALGITSGTTSTTFSPNAAITRGQAAKMLRATEEAKPPMVTIKASDLKWEYVRIWQSDAEDGYFKAFEVFGTEGYTEDKIQVVPVKEGKGILNLQGRPSKGSNVKDYVKYYVHITKVNGELTLTLEETEDMAPTAVQLYDIKENIETISLATMEGEKISDNVPFNVDQYTIVSFDIDNPGQYIATVKLESGKEIRYGIEAKQNDAQSYYDVEAIRENPTDVYVETEKYKGGFKIREKDAAQIAEITRDPGTNTFRIKATGKKEGTVHIDYDHRLTEIVCEGLECSSAWIGFVVDVRQIGSIVNVYVRRDLELDH